MVTSEQETRPIGPDRTSVERSSVLSTPDVLMYNFKTRGAELTQARTSHWVKLKGGGCVTPRVHSPLTYRYYPVTRARDPHSGGPVNR